MLSKGVRALISVIGIIIGIVVVYVLQSNNIIKYTGYKSIIAYAIGGIIFLIIINIVYAMLKNRVTDILKKVERILREETLLDILSGSMVLIICLIMAFFFTQPLLSLNLPIVGNSLSVILSVVIYIVICYVGLKLFTGKKSDILRIFKKSGLGFSSEKKAANLDDYVKVMDTSVIIDGRILGVIETGFLEGLLVVPQFVIEELQHIADSEDNLRRQKGRRGLDLLNKIQKDGSIKVKIVQTDYPEIKEVDMKLLRLTNEMKGKILTNDFNLNKVAEVNGIKVLNVNELSNSIKPVVIPGEEMQVDIIKAGSERNQGIGYLNDGTMIVVEEAKNKIGEKLYVEVTSVLQTSAGKMIFTKIK